MTLIEHGATVDMAAPGKEFRGQTALHIAAGRGPLGLVSTLIGCGADPSRGAADGTLPVEAVSSWSTRDAEQARGLCMHRTRTVHMHCARGVFLRARLVCTAHCAAHARDTYGMCRCAACSSRPCGSVRSAPVGSSSLAPSARTGGSASLCCWPSQLCNCATTVTRSSLISAASYAFSHHLPSSSCTSAPAPTPWPQSQHYPYLHLYTSTPLLT